MSDDIAAKVTLLERQVALLQQALEHETARTKEQFASEVRETARALTEANKRLDEMNNFRGANSDLIHSLMPRMEYETAHKLLIDKIDQQGKPNYVLLATFATIFVGAITGLWRVLDQEIQLGVSPMKEQVGQIEGRQATDAKVLVELHRVFEEELAENRKSHNDLTNRVTRLETERRP